LPAVTGIFFNLLSRLGGKLAWPYSILSVVTRAVVVVVVVVGAAVVVVVVVVVLAVVVVVVDGVVLNVVRSTGGVGGIAVVAFVVVTFMALVAFVGTIGEVVTVLAFITITGGRMVLMFATTVGCTVIESLVEVATWSD
jgi:hypothetical protein